MHALQSKDDDGVVTTLQVMAHHAVGCHAVVVAKPGAIKKTTSGKVQRRACRAAFMAGEYSQVGVPSLLPPYTASAP